ncbi:MAG: tagatose 1,6-diphosphate aldolase [Bryobacterales bacterium]|nr:tagatose 1,6-diphosphate aldolase [Bryobacterales bacterium]
MSMKEAKRARLRGLSTPGGIIAALAMDQRRSLRAMLAQAAGTDPGSVKDSTLVEFKTAVSKVLTPHVSAVLLDPEYGQAAMRVKAPGCGLLVTYEADGWENPRPHRMLALMPHYSVQRIAELGGQAIKVLLSWAPDGDPAAHDEKQARVERIGAECEANGIPFLLEPVVYDPAGFDANSPQWAARKPALVVRTMEEFSKPRYRVDVLKVEFPVSARFVEGTRVADAGLRAWSHAEAAAWFQAADSVTAVPYIYLSAGVTTAEFEASLELAGHAGARYSGVLCGRATWQGGLAPFVKAGVEALTEWLGNEGVRNVKSIGRCLEGAVGWDSR